MTSRTFVSGGLAIAVEAEASDLDWLSEFLAPAFVVTRAATPDVHVSFGWGDLDSAPSDAPTRNVFTLDAGPVQLPAVARDEGLWRLHWPTGHVVFDVADRGRVTAVRYNGSRLGARVLLMRVLREYAHTYAVRVGRVVLHAAGVAASGRVLAIAGRKGAGKTTLLLRLIEEPGVDFVANDRVLVDPSPVFHASGVPTVVSLQPGSRAMWPALAARLEAAGDFRLTAEERRQEGDRGPVVFGRAWHLSAQQLCHASGCGMSAGAPLGGIVFLRAERGDHTALRRLDAAEAARAISLALLSSESGVITSDVFVNMDAAPPSARDIADRCRSIAAAIPCFDATVSPRVDDAVAALRSAMEESA